MDHGEGWVDHMQGIVDPIVGWGGERGSREWVVGWIFLIYFRHKEILHNTTK